MKRMNRNEIAEEDSRSNKMINKTRQWKRQERFVVENDKHVFIRFVEIRISLIQKKSNNKNSFAGFVNKQNACQTPAPRVGSFSSDVSNRQHVLSTHNVPVSCYRATNKPCSSGIYVQQLWPNLAGVYAIGSHE
jgi:hypothetical protein